MKIALLVLSLTLGALAQTFYPRPAGLDTSRLLVPEDLEYQGAFRPPAITGYTYLVGAMAYSSENGGSLLLAGHAHDPKVGRISIPTPSTSRTWSSLPVAAVLQAQVSVGTMPGSSGVPVMGLEESGGRVYVTMGDGYLPTAGVQHPMLSSTALNLSGLTARRAFTPDRVDCYGEYLFQIPKAWADRYTPGKTVAVGRHREGDMCGCGPTLYAMDPAATGSTVPTTTLLKYQDRNGVGMVSNNLGGDEYFAGAWLESGKKSAVLMTGQKGLGDWDYGTICGVQGYHATGGYRPYFIFLNPDSLGKVAQGGPSYRPQPYAGQDINARMMAPNATTCDNSHLQALAYDRVKNVLYGLEKSDTGERPAIHVWKVKQYAAAPVDVTPPDTVRIIDTLRIIDTVRVRDTLRILDTLLRVDTVTVRDTLYRDTTFLFQLPGMDLQIRTK